MNKRRIDSGFEWALLVLVAGHLAFVAAALGYYGAERAALLVFAVAVLVGLRAARVLRRELDALDTEEQAEPSLGIPFEVLRQEGLLRGRGRGPAALPLPSSSSPSQPSTFP